MAVRLPVSAVAAVAMREYGADRRRARAELGDGEGVSLDGPALSVVLRNTRREATQRPEIRRKSARDQGLE